MAVRLGDDPSAVRLPPRQAVGNALNSQGDSRQDAGKAIAKQPDFLGHDSVAREALIPAPGKSHWRFLALRQRA